MGGLGSGWQGAKKATVERGLILSIKGLARVGALDLGWRDGSLRWHYRGQDEPIAAINYHSVIRADGTGSLWLRYTAEGESVYDSVSLVSTVPHYGGRRWWFKCPFQNIRVAKLYLRPGATHFASRKAYDLTYQSCQKSGSIGRLCRRVAKLTGQDEAELRSLLGK